jgi:hypothetical protein
VLTRSASKRLQSLKEKKDTKADTKEISRKLDEQLAAIAEENERSNDSIVYYDPLYGAQVGPRRRKK